MLALLAALALQPTFAEPDFSNWAENFDEQGAPIALNDPGDRTIWPNRWSFANSDPWIARNHDQIRQMRPRLLLISFVNQVDEAKALGAFQKLAAAVKEGSRYHGYKNPEAPAFLDYQVFKFVNMGDPDGDPKKNTKNAPIKASVTDGKSMNTDYGAFFSDEFAEKIGVRDPRNPKKFLNLTQLLDRGYVHEVWATAAADGIFRSLECVELKPVYDALFRKHGEKFVQSGNGGDDDQPWTGRSVRINILNYDRGIGCGMENLAHSFEGMAHGEAIPYFTKYFDEFAGFDLDKRYGLPFDSFYVLWGEGKGISYPSPDVAVVTDGEKTWRLENYVAAGGNVHFPPNGRKHYDQNNTEPVNSTIEDWRCGSGPGGKDEVKPWTNAVLEPYKDLAPDCMGKWLVYWRQNIPGLDNQAKDDDGRPMKNWWPFLFY